MSLFDLIPAQYRVAAKIIALILVVAMVFSAGWAVRGWKDEVAYQALVNDQLKGEKDRAEQALAAQKQAMKERDTAQQKVTDADKKYTEDMADAKKKIDDLRYCIAHGTCRVRVPADPDRVPTTSSNSSGGDAGKTCELSRQTADDLLSIAADGDDAIRQLSACQNILKAIISR